MNECNNCHKTYEGNSCMRSFGCAYATTSISQIDKENGYNCTVDGVILTVNPELID